MTTNKESQALETIAKKMRDHRETLKNDSLVTMGSMKSCEELFEKHKLTVAAAKEEMIKEIQQGELSQDCANYCLKHLDKITQMIKQFSSEKLHHYYAKVGALNAVEACIKIVDQQQKELEASLLAPPMIEDLSSAVRSLEKRPDDEGTKMGKKLKDIRTRKKKAQY